MVIESFVAVTVIDLPYPKNSLCKTITATHPIKKVNMLRKIVLYITIK